MKLDKTTTNNHTGNVLIYSHTKPDIGYVARTTTQGQEFNMVRQYIRYLFTKYNKLRNKKAAIFIEPQLDTGYPDIVIVEYFSLPSTKWKENRNHLSITDLKILYYIQTKRRGTIVEISNTLGYPLSLVEKSVLRLNEANLIHLSKSKKSVRNVPLNTYCRIHKIIAIEAKIDKWNEAIRQANNNIWFATESYILLNKGSCSATVAEKCKASGIGIILVNGKVRKVLPSAKRPFPVSYASLQFNEWLLRDINRQEETV